MWWGKILTIKLDTDSTIGLSLTFCWVCPKRPRPIWQCFNYPFKKSKICNRSGVYRISNPPILFLIQGELQSHRAICKQFSYGSLLDCLCGCIVFFWWGFLTDKERIGEASRSEFPIFVDWKEESSILVIRDVNHSVNRPFTPTRGIDTPPWISDQKFVSSHCKPVNSCPW